MVLKKRQWGVTGVFCLPGVAAVPEKPVDGRVLARVWKEVLGPGEGGGGFGTLVEVCERVIWLGYGLQVRVPVRTPGFSSHPPPQLAQGQRSARGREIRKT